ncbi:MAG TPA: hypothetical protein VMU38_07775 [Candidatus Binatia bacterium]|nr:hypothetical protein [Candidatus Binatia bacterium]
MIQCFWLEPTRTARRSLRRYSREGSDGNVCKPWGYHNAQAPIDDVPFEIRSREDSEYGFMDFGGADRVELFAGDARWPAKCEHCDYRFVDDDPRQVFMDEIYRRADTGALLALRDVPPGAMWDAWWYGDAKEWSWPIDGVHLMVRCPDKPDGSGHADWYVDGRAGNAPADRRGEKEQRPPRSAS